MRHATVDLAPREGITITQVALRAIEATRPRSTSAEFFLREGGLTKSTKAYVKEWRTQPRARVKDGKVNTSDVIADMQARLLARLSEGVQRSVLSTSITMVALSSKWDKSLPGSRSGVKIGDEDVRMARDSLGIVG